MYVFASQLNSRAIISLQTAELIAIVQDLIISPEKLELVAFVCFAPELEIDKPLLAMKDIRQIAQDCVVVDSANDLTSASDIVRLQPLLNSGFRLQDTKVYTESGTLLGKTTDYSLNLDTKLVQRLTIRPTLLKRLLAESFIIDRAQIVDVKPGRITVRDNTVPIRTGKRLANVSQSEELAS